MVMSDGRITYASAGHPNLQHTVAEALFAQIGTF